MGGIKYILPKFMNSFIIKRNILLTLIEMIIPALTSWYKVKLIICYRRFCVNKNLKIFYVKYETMLIIFYLCPVSDLCICIDALSSWERERCGRRSGYSVVCARMCECHGRFQRVSVCASLAFPPRILVMSCILQCSLTIQNSSYFTRKWTDEICVVFKKNNLSNPRASINQGSVGN